jgi:hypothetical protein
VAVVLGASTVPPQAVGERRQWAVRPSAVARAVGAGTMGRFSVRELRGRGEAGSIAKRSRLARRHRQGRRILLRTIGGQAQSGTERHGVPVMLVGDGVPAETLANMASSLRLVVEADRDSALAFCSGVPNYVIWTASGRLKEGKGLRLVRFFCSNTTRVSGSRSAKCA